MCQKGMHDGCISGQKKVLGRIWEEFGKSLDNDHCQNTERFWQTVKLQKENIRKSLPEISKKGHLCLSDQEYNIAAHKT